MKIMDGKALASKMRLELKTKIEELKAKIGLAVVLVGEDPASQVYVRNKIRGCEEVGITSFSHFLPKDASQEELEKLLETLACDEKVHGILLQLPLPKHLNTASALAKIPFEKDVDGFCAENVGKLVKKEDACIACTPFGVMKMLEDAGVDVCGKHAVVLGRSETVGKPMALLLLNANATVTVCHSKTQNLKEHCLQADILVSAIGKAKFVTANMVKDGAIVVDVGINRDENGKLCGDVDFERVKEKVSLISPVPGGVGPMTITMLLYNTFLAWRRREGR